MTENVKLRQRWPGPKLEFYEDFIVQQRQGGASLRGLQKQLRQRFKVRASVSTISRYLKSLPTARFDNKTARYEPKKIGTERRSRKQKQFALPIQAEKTDFRRQSAEKQAQHWANKGSALGTPRRGNQNDGLIHSVGTKRNYEGCMKRFCEWIQANKMRDLESASVKNAVRYLEERSHQVGQKTLDLDRQALQFLFRQTIGIEVRLGRIKSTYSGDRQLAKEQRAYTLQQLDAVCSSLTPRSALAARLCFWSGLRAHELLTLRPGAELSKSTHRAWSADRFDGRTGEIYVVIGKGGLRREVILPRKLATELEARRLSVPNPRRDRGINYRQYYDLTAGKSMSRAWTSASKTKLGWSSGLHGLRHSYAQNRMHELQALGYGREERKAIVSQELGHFRTTETETYLR